MFSKPQQINHLVSTAYRCNGDGEIDQICWKVLNRVKMNLVDLKLLISRIISQDLNQPNNISKLNITISYLPVVILTQWLDSFYLRLRCTCSAVWEGWSLRPWDLLPGANVRSPGFVQLRSSSSWWYGSCPPWRLSSNPRWRLGIS